MFRHSESLQQRAWQWTLLGHDKRVVCCFGTDKLQYLGQHWPSWRQTRNVSWGKRESWMLRMEFPASHIFDLSRSWWPSTHLQLMWKERACLRPVQNSWAPRWPQDFTKGTKYMFKGRKVSLRNSNQLVIHWITQTPGTQVSCFPYFEVFVYWNFYHDYVYHEHVLCSHSQIQKNVSVNKAASIFWKRCYSLSALDIVILFFCFTGGWYGNEIRIVLEDRLEPYS